MHVSEGISRQTGSTFVIRCAVFRLTSLSSSSLGNGSAAFWGWEPKFSNTLGLQPLYKDHLV